jgi:hypothetical protein
VPRNPDNPRPPKPLPADAVFMSSAELRNRYGGRSHMWLNRRLANDLDFPRPEITDPQRFWRIATVEAYEKLCAARPRVRRTTPPKISRRARAGGA